MHSIRWRFAVPFLFFILLVTAALSLYLFNTFKHSYQNSVETTLLEEARLIESELNPLIANPTNLQDLESQVHHYANDLNIRVTIIRADGVVIGESDADPAAMENHLNRPEVHQAVQGQPASAVRYSATLKTNMLYVAIPVLSGDLVTGVVRLARPLTAIESDLETTRNIIVSAAVVLAVTGSLIATLLTEYTVRPVRQLTAAVQRVSAGDYEDLPLPVSENEIGRLSQAFNQMSSEVQSQIQALESEQGKLSSILETMMDGVIIVDPDGKIQLMNLAAARMFRIDQSGSIDRSLISAISSYPVVDLWEKSVKTGKQQVNSFEIFPSRAYLQGIATPLHKALEGSTLLLFQDLTRQRKLETIRQDFIGNVSHELRTPLASLKALTETLQEGALDDPPAAQLFLERMSIEIDTLTQTVQELLELSRIESGQVPLNRKAIRVSDLLHKPFERMRVQAERAGISMTLNYPEDVPVVLADAERVEQVLVNLLHNAIKFTPPDGKIKLSASPDNGQVIIKVEDTGVGIASEDLPRVFERFYKADRARSGSGTGLGLSIARHIVEAHGGRIWAESEPGRGSCFAFSLALTAPPQAR